MPPALGTRQADDGCSCAGLRQPPMRSRVRVASSPTCSRGRIADRLRRLRRRWRRRWTRTARVERGLRRAHARVLVDPSFLFRFEREPSAVAAGAAYRIGDLELASRLSFFLWSSIPDDELIAGAAD